MVVAIAPGRVQAEWTGIVTLFRFSALLFLLLHRPTRVKIAGRLIAAIRL
jgi:hypothetical protein